ncbi:MAG: type IV secretory system conjugative DNA transfer family protein [Bacilli bacterium]
MKHHAVSGLSLFTNPATMIRFLFHQSPIVWIAIGAVVLVGSIFLARRTLGLVRLAVMAGLLAGLGYGGVRLTGIVAVWQHRMRHQTTSLGFFPTMPGGQSVAPTLNLNRINPLTTMPPQQLAFGLVAAAVILIVWLLHRSLTPQAKARLLGSWDSVDTGGVPKRKRKGSYELPGVELGVNKATGKAIWVDYLDRFTHTLVVGVTGTGKTSRILMKAIYQDLWHIGRGVPMDVLVVEPEGGLSKKTIQMAERLGIPCIVIDLRSEGGFESNTWFTPFAGGSLSDEIDNVRAVLREQMGEQIGSEFFRNTQDDLVRMVIQVQLSLWPETDFIGFADLITDLRHFRSVCLITQNHASKTGPKRNAKGEEVDPVDPEWAHEAPDIEARYDALDAVRKPVVLTATRGFVGDTRTEKMLENFETVTRGLKVVVGELASNEVMRRALGKSDLPVLDFKKFLQNTKDPGRLIAVVTGNRDIGKLFGKLLLVNLKLHALSRPDDEWTRRPVYVYTDEFRHYATNALSELFLQGRKSRVSMTNAIQARSHLKLHSNKDFLDSVEGNSRNRIYFPGPADADAQHLEMALGTVTTARETRSANEAGLFSSRTLDPRVSTSEQVQPRFRMEDLLFGLQGDEAIYVMLSQNQKQPPVVGKTSEADEWARKRREYREAIRHVERARKAKEAERKHDKPSTLQTELAPTQDEMDASIADAALIQQDKPAVSVAVTVAANDPKKAAKVEAAKSGKVIPLNTPVWSTGDVAQKNAKEVSKPDEETMASGSFAASEKQPEEEASSNVVRTSLRKRNPDTSPVMCNKCGHPMELKKEDDEQEVWVCRSCDIRTRRFKREST